MAPIIIEIEMAAEPKTATNITRLFETTYEDSEDKAKKDRIF